MRSTRVFAVLVAILAVLAASLSTTSAQAAGDVSAKARQPHVIKGLKAAEYGQTGKFYVKGQVTTYKNKIVKLQKKKCNKCAYRGFKQDRSDGKGKFRINFDGPRGTCYRVLVPGTAQYKPAYRPVGCIVAG